MKLLKPFFFKRPPGSRIYDINIHAPCLSSLGSSPTKKPMAPHPHGVTAVYRHDRFVLDGYYLDDALAFGNIYIFLHSLGVSTCIAVPSWSDSYTSLAPGFQAGAVEFL